MLHIWFISNLSQVCLGKMQTNPVTPLLPGQPEPHICLQHQGKIFCLPSLLFPHHMAVYRNQGLPCHSPAPILARLPAALTGKVEFTTTCTPPWPLRPPSSPLHLSDCSPKTPLSLVLCSRCSPASGLPSLCQRTNTHFSLCLSATFYIVHTCPFRLTLTSLNSSPSLGCFNLDLPYVAFPPHHHHSCVLWK